MSAMIYIKTINLVNANSVADELNTIAGAKSLGNAHIAQKNLSKFIANNKEIMVASKNNNKLRDALIKLREKISTNKDFLKGGFFSPEASSLINQINVIIDAIFPKQLNTFPSEVMGEICRYILLEKKDPCVETKKAAHIPRSPLDPLEEVSKSMKSVVTYAKKKLLEEKSIPLKDPDLGLYNVNQALDFIIQNELDFANLKGYKLITKENLQRLLIARPNLKSLKIDAEIDLEAYAFFGQFTNLVELDFRDYKLKPIKEGRKEFYALDLDLSRLTKLETLGISLENLNTLKLSNPLKHFSVSTGESIVDEDNFHLIIYGLGISPNLNVFEFKGNFQDGLLNELLCTRLSKKAMLEELHLVYWFNSSPHHLDLSTFQNLKKLVLVGNIATIALPTETCKLNYLYMYFSHIQQLILPQSAPALETIFLDSCLYLYNLEMPISIPALKNFTNRQSNMLRSVKFPSEAPELESIYYLDMGIYEVHLPLFAPKLKEIVGYRNWWESFVNYEIHRDKFKWV